MDLEKALHEQDFFYGIDDKSRAEILKKGKPLIFMRGDSIFQEGTLASKCYLLLEGKLKLTKVHEEGKSFLVSYVEPGEIVGIIALFKHQEYPVSCEAALDSKLVSWTRNDILLVLKEFPEIAINMIKIVIERLHQMQRRYLEMYAEEAEKRIARTILRFMRQSGKKVEEGILIDFPLTRQEIAEYTGTTLYTVSRAMSSWEKKDWVKSKHKRIIVKNPHALIDFSESF